MPVLLLLSWRRTKHLHNDVSPAYRQPSSARPSTSNPVVSEQTLLTRGGRIVTHMRMTLGYLRQVSSTRLTARFSKRAKSNFSSPHPYSVGLRDLLQHHLRLSVLPQATGNTAGQLRATLHRRKYCALPRDTQPSLQYLRLTYLCQQK